MIPIFRVNEDYANKGEKYSLVLNRALLLDFEQLKLGLLVVEVVLVPFKVGFVGHRDVQKGEKEDDSNTEVWVDGREHVVNGEGQSRVETGEGSDNCANEENGCRVQGLDQGEEV